MKKFLSTLTLCAAVLIGPASMSHAADSPIGLKAVLTALNDTNYIAIVTGSGSTAVFRLMLKSTFFSMMRTNIITQIAPLTNSDTRPITLEAGMTINEGDFALLSGIGSTFSLVNSSNYFGGRMQFAAGSPGFGKYYTSLDSAGNAGWENLGTLGFADTLMTPASQLTNYTLVATNMESTINMTNDVRFTALSGAIYAARKLFPAVTLTNFTLASKTLDFTNTWIPLGVPVTTIGAGKRARVTFEVTTNEVRYSVQAQQ